MGETSRKIRSGGRTVTSLAIHIAQGEKSQHKDPGFLFTCVSLYGLPFTPAFIQILRQRRLK